MLSPVLAHASAVEREADRLGLVGPRDRDQIARRHSADSLLFALVRRPTPAERWIDVGSGAGFPGLVLAVCFPDTYFTLLEPLKRRAGFLELQTADLGLANVQVDARRLDEVEDAAFRVGVARALDDPGRALKSMVRVIEPGGLALVAVGSNEPAPAAPGVQDVLVADFEDVDSPRRFFMMSRGA